MQFNKILPICKVGGARVEEAAKLISKIERSSVLQKAGLEIIKSWTQADDKTLVVPIGGDGTVLHAAKSAVEFGLPLLGVNLGNIGFLTDLYSDEAIDWLQAINEPNLWIEEERTLLRVEHTDCLALNDFVISDTQSDSIIRYNLRIGAQDAGNHKANGVIVATPTGSTAYALYVGGSIIEPSLDVIEIIPVAAMSMSSRPIIASGKSEIRIKIQLKPGRKVSLKADGQDCDISAVSSDGLAEIVITQYDKKVRMLHMKDWNFFSKMTDKLGWNNI